MFELIKQKTEKQGKTLYWLAKELGVSRQFIYGIKNNQDIKLSTAFKIADVLGIDINEFRKEVIQ